MAEEDAPTSVRCPLCGRMHASANPDSPCTDCRRDLVRRSAPWAWLPALAVAAAYGWLLVWSGLIGSTFVVVWLAFGAVLAFVAYKVGHRVGFDVVRSRRLRRARR